VALYWIAAMVLRYGLACIIVLTSIDAAFARQRNEDRRPFIAGEVLRYRVRWSVFRLGTVTIGQVTHDSGKYIVEMTVRSSPSLPFIDVDFLNRTILCEQRQSITEEIITSGKTNEKTVYRYDATSHRILMEDSVEGERVRLDTLNWETECYDALGLLMYCRRFAGSGRSVSLPTLNDYRIGRTDVVYLNEPEEIEVLAFEGRRRCLKAAGFAHWVGKSFAGMKGPFRGWFTDDESAIPLKAEVEIFLGSIVLELESYQRPRSIQAAGAVDSTSK
jgi:hypothetical protein